MQDSEFEEQPLSKRAQRSNGHQHLSGDTERELTQSTNYKKEIQDIPATQQSEPAHQNSQLTLSTPSTPSTPLPHPSPAQAEQTEQRAQQREELEVPVVPAEPGEPGEELSVTSTSRPALPSNGLQYALIGGVSAGILNVLLSIVVTFINSGTFAQANKEIAANGQPTISTALAVTGVACLGLIVDILVCVAAGYFVGRLAVQRQLGFLAGAIAGALIYIGSFVVRYIPNYPGNTAASITGGGGPVAGGILLSVIFLLVWALIGGLVGLLGAWLATRNHPYYREEI